MIVVYINLFVDTASYYSDVMSEQIDLVEVEVETTESDESFSVYKNTNMVDNHSRQDDVISESKICNLILFV